MIKLAAKTSRALRIGKGASFLIPKQPLISCAEAAALPFTRQISSKNGFFAANPVAVEMINYATALARDQKTEDSYARGLLILDQCESAQNDDYSKGLVELARSTLLFERGSNEAAIERLRNIQNLSLPLIAVKVAAAEALAGIYLECDRANAASVAVDLTLQLLETIRLEIIEGSGFGVLETRMKAVKGLIELINGNLHSGNASLSLGEYLHGLRRYSTAKELYQKVLQKTSEIKDFSDPNNLGACNMTSEEVAIAATCALGQLEAHIGNFNDAEEILTVALKKMEDRWGPSHPKVGIILTCIALMYQLKATRERSSSLLVQEGLFRRAIELLKAPSLEVDGASENVLRRDIIALARGGYAETLCVQQPRKAEGERLKKWAESAWRNRWMSLGEALELAESCPKVPVIDTRICRVL
ncbi:hypothetical protein F511_30861 [Dorcoceras hygrometricum]|uniref:Uncharacterized protein n=1 Tax=Dorcoceras hygrometricum TaxID=472368 RepID=A0A2Z7BVX2_9LAMI|nr:hypothetical protein F511_30861 [Dorcoceras hygrometricum]